MCSCSIFCIKCLKFVFVEINEMCGIQFSSFFAFFPRGCSNKGEVMVMIKGKSLVNSKMHSGKQLIRLIKTAIGKIYLKLNSHSQARSKHSSVKLNNIAGRLNHLNFQWLLHCLDRIVFKNINHLFSSIFQCIKNIPQLRILTLLVQKHIKPF